MAVLKSLTIDNFETSNLKRVFGDATTKSVPSGTSTLWDYNTTEQLKAIGKNLLVVVQAVFPANATGYRQVSTRRVTGSTSTAFLGNTKVAAANSGITAITLTTANTLTSEQHLGVAIMHNAGAALNVTVDIAVYEIG